jgi:hypothetical protein
MVREQTWRRRKYEAKVDPTVSELRIDAYGAKMKDLHRSITSTLVAHEEAVKAGILEPAGVATSEMPFYLNAMREFCKTSRNWTSTTRDNKCYSILCTYRDKGLRVDLLYRLAMHCGCYPAGYEYY